MSVLSSTKPDAWTLSPQMTAAPELWRGCISFMPLWEGQPPINDVVTGVNLSLAAGASGLTLADNGRAVLADGTRYYRALPVPFTQMSGSAARTTAYFIRKFASDNNGYTFSVGADNIGQVWRCRFDSDRLRIEANGGFSIADYSPLNKGWVVVAHTNPGDDVANTAHYADGYNVAVASSSTQSLDTVSDRYTVLAGDQEDDVANGVELSFIAHWSRELSEAEIRKLSRDPFAMLRPAGF